jgi:hypothetical protein
MLGKLKRDGDVGVSGPQPLATAPYPLHTIYPLSREALGAASPLFFSEILEAKFSRIFEFQNPS